MRLLGSLRIIHKGGKIDRTLLTDGLWTKIKGAVKVNAKICGLSNWVSSDHSLRLGTQGESQVWQEKLSLVWWFSSDACETSKGDVSWIVCPKFRIQDIVKQINQILISMDNNGMKMSEQDPLILEKMYWMKKKEIIGQKQYLEMWRILKQWKS